jgi:cytochrome P450
MGPGFPLLSDDPPRHSTLRGLVSKAFSPARMEAMKPEIEAIARSLASRIEVGQEVDIVSALTTPLPVTVIARMLGIAEADNARFKRWSDAITGLMDNPMAGERMQTLGELRSYFLEALAARRRTPGEDLISALANADEAGVSLSDEEVVGFSTLLLIAGNETTTNLLGNLLNRLATDPGAFVRLKADPGLVSAAIEEALRVDSPAQFIMRSAREDTDVGNQAVAKGEMLIVYLAAANRDPAKWTDPVSFDLARERDRHIAFGHGVHNCIGAPLARLEAHAAITALLERFGGVSYGAVRGRRLPSGLLYGFRSLPLVFS